MHERRWYIVSNGSKDHFERPRLFLSHPDDLRADQAAHEETIVCDLFSDDPVKEIDWDIDKESFR